MFEVVYNGDYSLLAYTHIVFGTMALISGALSFAVAKGSLLHRRSGAVFVTSMVIMATSGDFLAFLAAETLNMVAGLITFYLVLTAYFTVRSPNGNTKSISSLLMIFGFLVGVYAIYTGVTALNNDIVSIDGNPVQVIIGCGSVAMIASLLDANMLLKRRLTRKWQLVRHVWRIGFAMFIATASFFLGQSQFIP